MDQQLPLRGVRIVEFEAIGPGPVAGRILAGMGAEVTALVRPGKPALNLGASIDNPLREGKQVIVVDLKTRDGVAQALEWVTKADVLIEGNRPGVMERLGLGPEICLARNRKLVYGRMTGWGQEGPLAQAAGHDLNYVALTGLLSLAARNGEAPMVPPTVMGDASGALGLAFGIACALLEARSTGRGRVVDAAIVDVVSMLGMLAQWVRARGNLDGPQPSAFHDSPYYDTYACADGKYVSIAAMEPQFYQLLLDKLGMADVDPARQNERADWPALKARFADCFRTRTRAQWCELLEGTDVCFAPVLTIAEAAAHPHNAARGIFREVTKSDIRPAVAPRFGPLPTFPSQGF
ncbi:CaiB/BaiF CoA-transferase family protein [Hydrogenophaga sp. 2FB]|uniref:CaiB/BaiF CoA transferase family protein n=1 Tax=Hydrogenophaga sp. 2FB TaxID=2502187 RepID=UPI0010F7976C|nr:CaiB/BaiF CoA-transferase family protein [Hydrogenophaga sp. 2FB]